MAVLLDGGHLRVHAYRSRITYDPALIERAGLACRQEAEEIHRILYYDCAPFSGTVTLPVSGQRRVFTGNDQWLHELARKDLFAIRLGSLKFRGFVLRNVPYQPSGPLQDSDFEPKFEQKGVDMRIGMDIAGLSHNRSVDLIALATNDTDCIPAMKYARRCGLQIALVAVPGYSPAPELLEHSDYFRSISWPE
ncbi:MAG: NYN domain-containing protein [Acidobacteria bacterium]|nr:NYN domain-containing protein [Acidobacteriota bacterium]